MSEVIERPRNLWRVPSVKRKEEPAFDFVPVIFANGVDDDLPGFEAAVKNERVQFDEHIYEEGEALLIDKRELYFSIHHVTILGVGRKVPSCCPPDTYVIQQREDTRPITITNCTFWMGRPKP